VYLQVQGTTVRQLFTHANSSDSIRINILSEVFFMGRPWREEYKGMRYQVYGYVIVDNHYHLSYKL